MTVQPPAPPSSPPPPLGKVELARGRPAYISSVSNNPDLNAGRAVDGVTQQSVSVEPYCTQTAGSGEPKPWWYVDLGSARRVSHVNIFWPTAGETMHIITTVPIRLDSWVAWLC